MSVRKREDELKAALFVELRKLPKTFELLPIQDVRKSGTPDFTLNGIDKTTWWEVKHATPNFSSPGIQEIMCSRLARTSFCRYIIYVDGRVWWPTKIHEHDQFTVIVPPSHVFGHKGKLDWQDMLYRADHFVRGFNHEKIAALIAGVHL